MTGDWYVLALGRRSALVRIALTRQHVSASTALVVEADERGSLAVVGRRDRRGGAIRRGDSARVVEAHLTRIAAVNDRLNAITVLLEDDALTAADALHRRLATGADAGALAGVPMTVKENVGVARSATTHGIARCAIPELGMRWHTDNALRGAIADPWSASHTPGASSGGDAALKRPSAESARWPRPRRRSRSSCWPSVPRWRAPATTRLALRHICGAVDVNPWRVPADVAGPPLARRASLVVPADVHADLADALQRAAGALRDAGYDVEEAEPPLLQRAARSTSRS